MTQQKGFTLIELIIVIVILGILAVTAAPRFFDFGSDARAATLGGLESSVKGAMEITYARALVAGESETASVSLSNPAVDIVFGYPAATATGIMEALADDSDWGSVVATADVGAVTTDDLLIYPSDVSVTATVSPDTECYLIYTEAADASTPPSVEVVSTGC
ncbi:MULTISPECIES: prepilin-type N-terminal cleavage/methylation domain-containing protein [Gammaproteobacteria]|uniref:prepilin-type N-terminal cleavage/methylation domain-containing protein n=1 Tax=Gammaproteobacteria TaxID=1236 RepID=UPI000DCF700A|nr:MULTISPECIES: prepilin-type N-terminal cleavage/methylation domain-containing protein [Gammaproteobacteria]RTE86385.1 prepilin-type N-terminal cleavage/methylation domain-containing protein [Aliidiomarina sp. B3213]TCZ91733.1 prepilin-type N-terminal cleavage/methylation domain-containing protein [Lysobacter sp. N42]